MTEEKPKLETRDGAVKSLATTFRILNCLQEQNSARVTDLANELSISKSSVHNHLSTLEANDFVVKDDQNRYRIGLRFLEYGGYARHRLELYQVAKPELKKLADETGEIVNLVVEEHGLGVYIDVIRGSDAVNLDTYVGRRDHLHSTAFGKAILANLPESRVEKIIQRRGLPAITDQTITSRTDLNERLEVIRERGYAVDEGERLNQLRCFAAPVKNSDGDVQGAVSVSGPARRLQIGQLERDLAEEVIQTTNVIEVNLTYT